MNNQQQPKLYPAWRQALSELLLADLQPGTVIEKTWLEEKFDIKPPNTIAEAEKNQSVFRFFIWKLREELLKEHRLMLRPIDGVGYRVVESEEQTATALRDRGEEINRSLSRLMDEISYVQTDKLDDAARKTNSDAVAKVGTLMGMVKKKLSFGKD